MYYDFFLINVDINCGNTIYLSTLEIFTSGQGLDLVTCKAWHPHGFVAVPKNKARLYHYYLLWEHNLFVRFGGIFTPGQGLNLVIYKARHPTRLCPLASVGMLILQSLTSLREAPPLCFISLSSKHKGPGPRVGSGYEKTWPELDPLPFLLEAVAYEI